jgi:hypothetical protein
VKNNSTFKSKKFYLFFLVSLFAVLKLAYINTSFVDQLHADKFGTYIPNVIYSREYGDYLSRINPSNVIFYEYDKVPQTKEYGEFPFFQVLTPVWFLADLTSPEVVVNGFLGLMGVVILLLIYKIFDQLGKPAAGLIVISSLVLNPLFHLFTGITTMDLPAFIFFLLSIYFDNKNKKSEAYLSAGFSILMKLSFGPIILGYYAYKFLQNRKETSNLELVSFGFLNALPYASFLVFLNKLPGDSSYWYLKIPAFVITNLVAVYLSKIIIKKKINISLAMYGAAVLVGIAGVLLMKDRFLDLANNFLTEPELFFTFSLYEGISSHLLKAFPFALIPLIFVGALSLLKTSNKKYRDFSISLGLSLALYFGVGAKPIFFHYYYKFYILFVMVVFTSVGLDWIISKSNSVQKCALLFLFYFVTTLLFITQINFFVDRSEGDRGVSGSAEYISQNIDLENDIVIRGDTISRNIILYKNIKIFNYQSLRGKTLERAISEIEEGGLNNFFKTYHIKYLINVGEVDFSSFAYLVDKDLGRIDRADQIDQASYEISAEDLQKIKSNFTLEKVIGEFFIYRIN